MAQRRRERTTPSLEGRAKGESENGIIVSEDNADKDRDEAIVGGVGEVPETPVGIQAMDEGEGGTRDELRTAMDEMEVGEDNMDEGKMEEAEGDDTEAEGGGD